MHFSLRMRIDHAHFVALAIESRNPSSRLHALPALGPLQLLERFVLSPRLMTIGGLYVEIPTQSYTVPTRTFTLFSLALLSGSVRMVVGASARV